MQTIKKRVDPASKQPEQEIVTLAHTLNALVARYRQPFFIVLVAVAAVAVVWGGYSLFRSQKEQKASPLVAAAYELYKPSSGAPADYGKAIQLFREVSSKYPGTVSGAVAAYYTANCLADLGKNDDAIKEYQEFIKRYSGEKFLLGLVYQRMGYLYVEAGKQEDARKSFEQAEVLLGPGAATIELAKQYEAAGNQAEAEKKYKIVLEKLAGTSWGRDAMGKVQKIAPAPMPAETGQSK